MFPITKEQQAFLAWDIDLLEKLPAGQGGEQVVVLAVDHFTKFVELDCLGDRNSFTVAQWFMEQIVARYGCPMVMRTDHGMEFQGEFRKLLGELRIEHHLSSVACPQAIGQVE